MNPTDFLINLLSPGLPALLNIYRQALAPQNGATSAGGDPYASMNPYSQYGSVDPYAGQYTPTSYAPQTSYPSTPSYSPGVYQGGPTAGNQATAINFRPVIVQNQTNSLPLHSTGGISATMNAGTSLNVNGASIFR